jgi:precorrin-3B C17-methyltransferase
MTGRVSVVGLGPGTAEWCTPAVRERLRNATDLVGYRRYLALVDRAVGEPVSARRHDSGNRVEAQRARHALELASEGGDVVVVSSGDAGVFAMASVVLEQLDAHPGRWGDLVVDIEPGITAASALASRSGAPLGHDFCVISLSDVLKPWQLIEQRLDAAARADFVLALYNPRSRHRPHQFADALKIIGRHRDRATPVVIGRQIGRTDESVVVTDLESVRPDVVDMSTLVIVGSTTTRRIDRPSGPLVYTPRSHGPVASDTTDTADAADTAAQFAGGLGGCWLLTGGARAGKSAFAERLAGRSTAPVVIVATAEPLDDDMAARIARHRADRPTHWTTVEEPVALADAVDRLTDDCCLVIDCVTVWVGNLFHHDGADAGERIEAAAQRLARAIAQRRGPSIVVTNEVGFGLVPDTLLGRRYRDTLGRVNATLAAVSDRVVLLSAGRAIELQALEDLP